MDPVRTDELKRFYYISRTINQGLFGGSFVGLIQKKLIQKKDHNRNTGSDQEQKDFSEMTRTASTIESCVSAVPLGRGGTSYQAAGMNSLGLALWEDNVVLALNPSGN